MQNDIKKNLPEEVRRNSKEVINLPNGGTIIMASASIASKVMSEHSPLLKVIDEVYIPEISEEDLQELETIKSKAITASGGTLSSKAFDEALTSLAAPKKAVDLEIFKNNYLGTPFPLIVTQGEDVSTRIMSLEISLDEFGKLKQRCLEPIARRDHKGNNDD